MKKIARLFLAFTIILTTQALAAGVVKVLHPNEAESFTLGDTISITYRLTNLAQGTKVTVDLYKGFDDKVGTIAEKAIGASTKDEERPNEYFIFWEVGLLKNGQKAPVDNNYRIRVTADAEYSPWDYSNMPFTIWNPKTPPTFGKQLFKFKKDVPKIGRPTSMTAISLPDLTPRIVFPEEGQLFDKQHPSYKDMYPYPYRLSYADRVDIDVRIKKWYHSGSGKGGGFSSIPILEKMISASQLSTKYTSDGSWAFGELLYMPPGKYQIDARAKLNESQYTPWCRAVTFFLGKKEISKDEFKVLHTGVLAVRTDLMPTKLYMKMNSGKCELWIKIKNLGQFWFRDKLTWEVYKNGIYMNTWGADHKWDIGPGDEVDIRLAYPAALPISPFGLNKWQVKLIPGDSDENEDNNEIGPLSLRCKKVPSEIKSLKRKETIQRFDKKDITLIILGSKRSYRSGEMVVFEMKGDTGKAPVIECFHNNRWSTRCPRDVAVRTMGTGAKTRYLLHAATPGKYRLRIGKLVSDAIEVKRARGKKTALIKPSKKAPGIKKEPGTVSPLTTQTSPEKKRVAKKQHPLKTLRPPVIRNIAPGTTYTPDTNISFSIKSQPSSKGCKITYELYRHTCTGRPFKVSHTGKFGSLKPGKYCVRAGFLRGTTQTWSDGIPFTVKEAKLQVKKVPALKQKKVPAVKQRVLKQ